MSSEDLKQNILEYMKDVYSKKRKLPSVRQIIKKFKINFTLFYQLFPGRLPEACRLADVPVPKRRIKRTQRALKEKEGVRKSPEAGNSISRLMLTEEQTRRIYGIMQLEGGKDPSLIVDDILDLDTEARKRKLSLAKRKRISEFLDASLDRGWRVNSAPNIIDSLTRAHNLGMLIQPPDTFKYFLGVLEWAKKSKWSTIDFVSYVTQFKNLLTLYMMAKQNRISRQEFERRASQYV